MNNDIAEQPFFADRNGGMSSRLSNSQFDPQAPSMAYSVTTDPGVNSTQKRHNSLPPSYSHQAAKRTHNPLQMQLPIQNNVPVAGNYAISASAARNSVIPVRRSGRNKAQYGSSPAANNLPSSKTPTPMQNYEVPLSPNSTFASNQNNSDLSALSPAAEQTTAARTHVTGEGDAPLPRLYSQQAAAMSQHPAAPSSSQQQQQQQQQRAMSEEEQQLANKLKETYKNIVSFEEIVQKACIEVTAKMRGNAATTELLNDLWTIYHHNITLLNNYHDFLVTALKPTANMTQFKTGRNIVDLYKIPRRMWVYGIVGYLEVLKNMMAVFQDHEIFLCFIAYCFSVVLNLTDPALEMEGWWCEKLGDLSRMAIALYSSRFIDWKISAEHWYAVSMKTMYGHGKIYYHMCTVQQDNLDALVNIGKSVICRDPFVPTQQYLRLVVENICTQRNILSLLELPIIDFIKIHKVLMSVFASQPRQYPTPDPSQSQSQSQPIDPSHDAQVQYGIDLVTRYGFTFGCDSQGYNFFTRTFCLPGGPQNKYGTDPYNLVLKEQHLHDQNANANALDLIEKTNFWFNKGALFAIANINHLVGLGDPKNPFAKLFQLPEVLQERRDKKERKKRSKSQSASETSTLETHHMLNSNNDAPLLVASDLSSVDWFLCLSHLNKSVMELSFRILNYYLIGPKQASTCHVIVWLYFLIAVGKGMQANPKSQNAFLWLFRKFFPWEALINYLNAVLSVVTNNSDLNGLCCDTLMNDINHIDQFNQLEFLPEVWKCWGTLWFDVICMKFDYNDPESAGVLSTDLFDLPICGTSPSLNVTDQSLQDKAKRNDKHNLDNDNDKRLIRVVLLACYIADEFDFGLLRTDHGFRFDQTIYEQTATNELIKSVASENFVGVLNYMRDVFFSDGRLSQGEFIIPISMVNLIDSAHMLKLNTAERDEQWFNVSSREYDDDSLLFDMKQEGGATNFPEANSNVDHADYNQQNGTLDTNKLSNIILLLGISYSETAHYGIETGSINANDNAQYLTPVTRADLLVEGDLGDRMDSSLTYITFDTNIWLKHCGKIYKSVRSKVINVLIPLIVFQELRSLRKSMEATIADAATRSVIIIRELYFAQELLPLRYDGTIASDINETSEFENNPHWMNNVDLTMLNVVNEYDEISKKLMKGLNYVINGSNPFVLDSKSAKLFRYCILITDDRNTRLRAKTSGLTSFQSKWLFAQLESLCPDQCID